MEAEGRQQPNEVGHRKTTGTCGYQEEGFNIQEGRRVEHKAGIRVEHKAGRRVEHKAGIRVEHKAGRRVELKAGIILEHTAGRKKG